MTNVTDRDCELFYGLRAAITQAAANLDITLIHGDADRAAQAIIGLWRPTSATSLGSARLSSLFDLLKSWAVLSGVTANDEQVNEAAHAAAMHLGIGKPVQGVVIPEDRWQDMNADEGDHLAPRLLATITVNGTDMHLEAIAVNHRQIDEVYSQQTANAEDSEDLDAIHQIGGATGPLAWTTIGGRPYVLVATPFED